jgi:hypothetical protein
LGQKEQRIKELEQQADQLPKALADLKAANDLLDLGGEAFHVTGETAIWIVIGRYRAWCRDMGWDKRGLSVPTRDDLVPRLPILTKQKDTSIGIYTIPFPAGQ